MIWLCVSKGRGKTTDPGGNRQRLCTASRFTCRQESCKLLLIDLQKKKETKLILVTVFWDHRAVVKQLYYVALSVVYN